MVVFPMLIPGSLQHFCRQSCCYKFENQQPNNVKAVKHCCSSSSQSSTKIFAPLELRLPSAVPFCGITPSGKAGVENSPVENRTPLKCPLEVCCQPSEIPTHLSFSFDFHREKESHLSPEFVKSTALCGVFFSGGNGIFSIPLKPFFEFPKLPLYLKNRILNV